MALRCLSQDAQTWAKLLERHLHVLIGISMAKESENEHVSAKDSSVYRYLHLYCNFSLSESTSQHQKVKLQPSIWIPQQDLRCQSSFPALSSEDLHTTLSLPNHGSYSACYHKGMAALRVCLCTSSKGASLHQHRFTTIILHQCCFAVLYFLAYTYGKAAACRLSVLVSGD